MDGGAKANEAVIPYFELSTGFVVLEALSAGYLVNLIVHQNVRPRLLRASE